MEEPEDPKVKLYLVRPCGVGVDASELWRVHGRARDVSTCTCWSDVHFTKRTHEHTEFLSASYACD